MFGYLLPVTSKRVTSLDASHSSPSRLLHLNFSTRQQQTVGQCQPIFAASLLPRVGNRPLENRNRPRPLLLLLYVLSLFPLHSLQVSWADYNRNHRGEPRQENAELLVRIPLPSFLLGGSHKHANTFFRGLRR